MRRWSVCKRDGVWRVCCDGHWYYSEDTLAEAYIEAYRQALADLVFDGCFDKVISLRQRFDEGGFWG